MGNSQTNINIDVIERLAILQTYTPSTDYFHNITLDENTINTAINKLNGKAAGTDNIPGECLKYGAPLIHITLSNIVRK